MSSLSRLAQVHLLGLALSLPLFLLNLRSEADQDDAWGALACFVVAVTYGTVFASGRPLSILAKIADFGLPARISKIVFLTVGLMCFGVAASYPFGAGVYAPLLVSTLLAGGSFLWAVTLALFSKDQLGDASVGASEMSSIP